MVLGVSYLYLEVFKQKCNYQHDEDIEERFMHHKAIVLGKF